MFTVFIFENAPSTARPMARSMSRLALESLADLASTPKRLWGSMRETTSRTNRTDTRTFNIGNLEGNYIKFSCQTLAGILQS